MRSKSQRGRATLAVSVSALPLLHIITVSAAATDQPVHLRRAFWFYPVAFSDLASAPRKIFLAVPRETHYAIVKKQLWF